MFGGGSMCCCMPRVFDSLRSQSSIVLGSGFPEVSGRNSDNSAEIRALDPNNKIGRLMLISARLATVLASTPPILATNEHDPRLAFLRERYLYKYLFFPLIYSYYLIFVGNNSGVYSQMMAKVTEMNKFPVKAIRTIGQSLA